MDVANNKPVHKWVKQAKISLKLHTWNKKAVEATVHSLNADVLVAINNIHVIINEIALKHVHWSCAEVVASG